MAEVNRCPSCSAELASDAPRGLCPACLLKQGFRSGPSSSSEAAGANLRPFSGPTTPFSPSYRFVPPKPAELAPYFPQLDIIDLIGQGGMGAVYKARQRQLNRFVALKILPPEVARDPSFSERFSRESQSLAQLSHPHIVAVYDSGETHGLYYFLMEYVDGTNLRQLIAQQKLEPRQALAIVPQICEALQVAHDEGVIHRDIKPENILIDKKGRVKIADFGLAKLLRPSDVGTYPASETSLGQQSHMMPIRLTGTGQIMGTPHYMAPEQMERPLTVDHRADIYSLGVVFYEMLTGELPLGRFAPPSRKAPMDTRLDEVVLRSLEKEPQRRYQQANDVKSDVEHISRTVHAQLPPMPTMATPVDASDVEAVRDQVHGPAIGLLIVGILQCLATVLVVGSAAFYFVDVRNAPNQSQLQNMTDENVQMLEETSSDRQTNPKSGD